MVDNRDGTSSNENLDSTTHGTMQAVDVVTDSPAETIAVGQRLAELLEVGDLVVLTGDLGAGKTKLVQGVGVGLGVAEPITSPTFALANRYATAVGASALLHHLDVYRLNVVGEAADLDLPELLDTGVVLVEWGEQIEAVLPENRLTITIEFPAPEAHDERRRLLFVAAGPSWQQRMARLGAALESTGIDDHADPEAVS